MSIFSDNNDIPIGTGTLKKPFYLLVVDDEEQIHSVTRLALSDYDFEGTPVKILSAYSAEEAKQVLRDYPDIGVILLDVVMETEEAGLHLADYIRNEMGNRYVRIILRTGQPGSAPETKVIREYDINDYKAKTELTAQRLYTSVHTALRSFRDMRALGKSKEALEKIIRISRKIFEKHLLDDFIHATLENIIALLSLNDSLVITLETHAVNIDSSGVEILSLHSSGSAEQIPMDTLKQGLRTMIDTALTEERNLYEGDRLCIFCKSEHHVVLFIAEGTAPLYKEDIELFEMFARNIQTALENIARYERLKKT
ncbi:MAG: DUF3369 domain-containing protein [Spirochaetales bacterium]|nr:DUF3369 domain-containing protein [Spirochaetales bacterium]